MEKVEIVSHGIHSHNKRCPECKSIQVSSTKKRDKITGEQYFRCKCLICNCVFNIKKN